MNKLITLLLALVLCPLTLSAQGKRYHGDGIDNVLEYVPLVATFTLKGCGVESASSWKRLAVRLSLGPYRCSVLWRSYVRQRVSTRLAMD